MTRGGPVAVAGVRRDYRAHLDGARAVAVLLVVAFHSGVDRAAGGFVGVDLFFVLSGYLVTGLLLSELDATGRIAFRDFYARRVRRLLPMALLVLTTAAVLFAALSPPLIVAEARGSFVAAFLYVANWWFINEATDYIGSDIESSPILHFWSLAIEEQFYVVWPLVMWGAARAARWFRSWQPVAAAVLVGGAASVTAALVVGARNVDRAYYGTDTRAYQLLLGAFLALVPPLATSVARRVAPAAAAGGLGALLFLGTDALDLSPITRGLAAALATAVLLLALESGEAGSVARGLSVRPLVEIGRLSYAIYLWHLPVMYVLRDTTDIGAVEMLVIATPVSVALSLISARLLENPVRYSTRLRPVPRSVVAGGLTLSIAGAALVVPLALDPDTTTTIRVDAAAAAPGDHQQVDQQLPSADAPAPTTDPPTRDVEIDLETVRRDRAFFPQCRADDPGECTVVAGDGRHVLMIGDSHAEVWGATWAAMAEKEGFTFSIAWAPRCSWHLDAMVVIADEIRDACFARQHEWIDRIVPSLAPDIVVLVHRAMFDPARPFFAQPDNFLAASDVVVDRLRSQGIEVVIVEPLPITSPDNDPLACLSDGRPVEECSFSASPDPTVLEERYRELGAEPGVTSLDLDHVACPRLPVCDLVVDGVIAWRDHSHMTATRARLLADDVLAAGFAEVLTRAD